MDNLIIRPDSMCPLLNRAKPNKGELYHRLWNNIHQTGHTANKKNNNQSIQARFGSKIPYDTSYNVKKKEQILEQSDTTMIDDTETNCDRKRSKEVLRLRIRATKSRSKERYKQITTRLMQIYTDFELRGSSKAHKGNKKLNANCQSISKRKEGRQEW